MTFNTYRDKLVKACIQGDRKAQKDLYDLFSGKMYVVAIRYSKTTAEAEDILQEGFLKVFQKIDTLKDVKNLEGWIGKIIINTALNQNRSKMYLFPMSEVHDSSSSTDVDVNLSELSFQELLSMICSLPDGCRIIFNMYAIEGWSHKEIAEELHINIGTSKSQLSRARTLLQAMIKKGKEVHYGTV